MLKIIQYILAIQALINVGTIDIIIPTNIFDKTMTFITYTFSSLYVFIEVTNFLKLNESNIIKLFFTDNSDYLLLKFLVTVVSNFMELHRGNQGLIKLLINIGLYTFYDDKTIFFNLMFSNLIFVEIVIPFIRIAYNNIFLGKNINILRGEKDKLINGFYYLTGMYFLSVVITQIYYPI